MTKEDFLKEGFVVVDSNIDPLTKYEKVLVSEDVINEFELTKDETPTLFFGTNGINTGFAVFTGACVIWINSQTPSEAVDFASKIIEFEPI